MVPPALWNACDYVIQFSFVIAHIPGAQNTAADYLSRLEADLKDKLVMKIREDVQTLPIEINVQSAGVSQEEQIFYRNDDDKTEEQYWARKEAIRKNPAMDEPAVTIQTLSTNLIKQQPEIQVRLRKTNQIIIEQSKDAVLQHLKAKLLHEEYSENVLQQDARYRHYACNLERIVVKEEILTRPYFDKTGNEKYAFLPTTVITDKGTAFTSTIIAENTQISGNTLKCATTKHPQTIAKIERTHASLKTNLKMA